MRWKSNDFADGDDRTARVLHIRGWRHTIEIEYLLFPTQTLVRGELFVKIATLVRARLSQHSRVETCGFQRTTRDSKRPTRGHKAVERNGKGGRNKTTIRFRAFVFIVTANADVILRKMILILCEN